MTLDLAVSTDRDTRLDLDKGADPAPLTDRGVVEVDEGADANVGAERAVTDQPRGGLIGWGGSDGETILAPASGEVLTETIRRLDEWGTQRDWRGSDPYEGLNARRAGPMMRSPLGKRLLIQLVKRSPLDLRPLLGIEPQLNSMSVAHVLAAYVRLASAGLLGPERVEWALQALRATRSEHYELPCWGYPFDVQTRFFFYAAGAPNVIATSFAVQALLDAHEYTLRRGSSGAEKLLEVALGACDFVLAEVPQTTGEGGAFFGYIPGDRTPIHNSNLLVCAMLARAGALAGRQELIDAAELGVGYALVHQRPDGSWPYAENEAGDWVDGFHTGYVLDALAGCDAALDDQRIAPAYERGLRLYAERLFLADGSPRGLADHRYPIDSQGAAQGIRTFSAAASAAGGAERRRWAERAWRVFGFARRSLRRRDGAFVFERRLLWTNRIPQVRWVQAPMLDAVARLAVLRADLDPDEAGEGDEG